MSGRYDPALLRDLEGERDAARGRADAEAGAPLADYYEGRAYAFGDVIDVLHYGGTAMARTIAACDAGLFGEAALIPRHRGQAWAYARALRLIDGGAHPAPVAP